MKKLAFIYMVFVCLFLSAQTNATLWDRGGGLIYDDILDITWLKDANYAMTSQTDNYGEIDGFMMWEDAIQWVTDLSFYDSVRGVYWEDWRLPTVGPLDPINPELAELAHLSIDYGISASSISNPGPFTNLQSFSYLYGTVTAEGYGYHTDFGLNQLLGRVICYPTHSLGGYVLAVRDGDVAAPVPEPATMLLLGTGLVGLAGICRKRVWKN